MVTRMVYLGKVYLCYSKGTLLPFSKTSGAGIAQWVEAGLVTERSRVRIPAGAAGFFFSRVDFLC